MEALLDIGLVLLPIAALVFLVRADSRASDRIFASFRDALARAGLPLRPGATSSSWIAGGAYDGVSVTVEPFTMRSGKSSVTRTVVRITDVTPHGDAAIYRTNEVPADQLGALREVTFPELGSSFRCFAALPDEVASWLLPETRATLASMSTSIVEVKLTSGVMIVVAEGSLARAGAVVRCVDLAVALYKRRAPRTDLPYDLRGGNSSRWALPAFVPFLPALICGFVLPIIPGVPWIFSPIVCGDRASLEMVWHQIGAGKYGGNLHCVDDKTHKPGDASFSLSTLLHFNLTYFLLSGALTARALGKKDELDEVHPLPAPAPYR